MKRKSIRRETLKEDKNNAIVSKLLGSSPADINIEKVRQYVSKYTNKTNYNLKGKISIEDLKAITCKFSPEIMFSLNLSHLKIEDVGDIVLCKNLIYLDLQNNQIFTLTPLKVCLKLKILNLANNMISSLEGISELKELYFLRLEGNNIKTQLMLNPLSSLPVLRSLYLQTPDYTNANQVCKEGGYRKNVFDSIKNLERLDGTPKSFVDPYEDLAKMFEGQDDLQLPDLSSEWYASEYPQVTKNREIRQCEEAMKKKLDFAKDKISSIEFLFGKLL